MTAVTDDAILESIADGVVQLRLNRPERMNALGHDMSKRLLAAVESALASKVRAILVRGTGKSFCAGADLKERGEMNAAQRAAHNTAINAFINALANAPVPTIAVINGLALGGGCELAMVCDMRIMAADATIGLTETRIGVIPGAGGTQRLPRFIGTAHALELMMTGEPIGGARAAEIGLVNWSVPADQLDAKAKSLASVIASRSPVGVRAIKKLVYDGLEMPIAQGIQREREKLLQVLASKDYAEGLAAFAAKRAPKFTGE